MKKFLTIVFLSISIAGFAQKRTVSGVVMDEGAEPLPGVNVYEKNSPQNGVITGTDGKYSITISDDNSTLIFSFIGFTNKEVLVSDQSEINVVLKSDAIGLDEVIAVGYGTVKKSDLTGSVASVKSDDIVKFGSVSLDQALAGRAPGVMVTQSSGVPGSGSTIKIRGVNSLRGSEPLYIIDGVPVDNTSLSAMTDEEEAGGQISPLSSVNPYDIESMEILKDASATAIYGSRGANGVIIITTRSGKIGKARINVDAEYGVSELPKQIDIQDANDYWLTRYEGQFNANSISGISETRIDSAKAGLLPTNNWQDAIFRKGSSQNYNVNMSGGNEKTRYLISTNFFDTKGIIENTDFSRVSTRANVDAKLNNIVDVGTRIYYAVIHSTQQSTTTNSSFRNGTNSIIQRALLTSPSAGIDAEDGDDGVQYYTPIQALEANNYDNFISQMVGNMFLKFNLSKDLFYKTDFSYQIRNANQRFYQKNILPIAYSRGGWSRTNDSRVRLYTLTNTLNFNKKFNKHKVNAVLGQSTEWFDQTAVLTSNYGYTNDILTYYAPETALFNDPDRVIYSDSRLASFFGRINYTYMDKWLFTFTGRLDGSSKFAENNKFAFFPAGALGYRLSEEPFLKGVENLSNLKLRISYGLSGNQAIQPYQSLDQFGSDKHPFGDGSGGEVFQTIYYRNQLPNANLRWETTAQLNLGFDVGLFNNRLSFTADYYDKITDNLLVVGNRIPSHSGFTAYTENLGKLESQGFELGLNTLIIDKDKFSWNIDGSISTTKTKFLELGSNYIESGYNQGWVSGGTQRLIEGEELGAFYGYQTTGISQFDDFVEFQGLTSQERIELYNADPMAVFTPITDENGEGGVISNRPGEQLYLDVNNDGVINELDKKVIGYAQPDLIFGINNSLNYKNFDLSFFIDGQLGQQMANVMNFQIFGFDDKQQLSKVRERWTPEKPSNVYPRLDAANSGTSNFKFSDRYIEDASFIRLQNVTLTYHLPHEWARKISVTSANIFVSVTNLLTISDYSGYSPDVSLNANNNLQMGHDNAGYPVSRTYRIGASFKF